MQKKRSSDSNMEKRPKLWPIYVLFFIIALITSLFAVYELFLLSTIETVLRYIVMSIILLIDVFLFFKIKRIVKPKGNKRKSSHILLIMFMIIYSAFWGVIGYGISFVYGKASSLNKTYVTYSSSLVVPSGSYVNKPNDFNNMKIAILEDKKSIEGYKIPMDIVRENDLQDSNELVTYEDYTSMIVDLYGGEIDGCFLFSGYIDTFSAITGYENIENDTKVVVKKEERLKKADTSKSETSSSGKNVKEPFTILLMGIDSTDEVLEKNAVANGDTLILITFNPKTLNATMLSIPRDSYVPIACWGGKPENKITHAAAYGNDCMIDTIENYFDVNIDYYAKINFKGLVKLVDALGGVEINVEKRLCTDDSNRTSEVCIEPGLQVLNGEQALVFARNRKQLANGDFGRNYHQQLLIMALMNKVKEINDVNTFMDLLNTVSNSMDTNFTTKQILSFYNVAKDIIRKGLSSDDADLINIERLYLQGSGQMIYDERARMVLYNYVPNINSKKDIIQAMKENLELSNHKPITSFSFSVNEPYEKPVIGYGPYNNKGSYNLLPDFTGDTEAQATSTCRKLGIKCTFKGSGGFVIAQSSPQSSRIDKVKNLVLTLSVTDKDNSKTDKTKDKETDKKKDNNKDKDKDKVDNNDKEIDDEKVNDEDKDDDTPSTSEEKDDELTPTTPSTDSSDKKEEPVSPKEPTSEEAIPTE